MATFLEMQNEVLAHGFAESYRSRVKNWLNECQSRVARMFELPNLYTTTTIPTVINQEAYTLPTDVVRINGVTNASSPMELTYVEDPADITYQNENGEVVGEPLYYTFTGTSLRLSPIPDAVYTLTLDYYKAPTTLSLDADVSLLPVDYHDVMISYALSRAYRSEDDPQMSQFFYAEYQRDVQYLGVDRQSVVRDGPRQVPGMWNI